jgi:hypothetical protein
VRNNAEEAAGLGPLVPAVGMGSRAEEIDQHSKWEEGPLEAPLSSLNRINKSIDSRIMAEGQDIPFLLATSRHGGFSMVAVPSRIGHPTVFKKHL